MAPRHEKPTKEVSVIFFFFNRAPRERKEAGTMPSAVRGAASPWFTGAGSDLLVVKVSVKYLYTTTSGSRTD